MHRTDFSLMTCSIARTLPVVAEPWSVLVLRDVHVGIRRFEELRQDLGISRKVLAERLRHLIELGLLEPESYSERPPRHQYVLTEKGADFIDVLLAIAAWGDRWTAGEAGPPTLYRHHACGQVTQVEPHCAACGDVMRAADVEVETGPGAQPAPRPSTHGTGSRA